MWPRSYISGTDLSNILDMTKDSRHGIIKRAIQNEDLTPIRRDLYLIKNTRQLRIDTFEIAPIIYGPSHISFESALSYHGWIPEAVKTTTSATIKRNKEFDTPLGTFSYEHVPLESFFLGVEQHRQNDLTLFIANPLKALADMIYARKRTWDTVEELADDLRIESENYSHIDIQLLRELIEKYPSQKVKTVLKGLFL